MKFNSRNAIEMSAYDQIFFLNGADELRFNSVNEKSSNLPKSEIIHYA